MRQQLAKSSKIILGRKVKGAESWCCAARESRTRTPGLFTAFQHHREDTALAERASCRRALLYLCSICAEEKQGTQIQELGRFRKAALRETLGDIQEQSQVSGTE